MTFWKCIGLVMVAYCGWRFFSWPTTPYSTKFEASEQHSVVKVVDGDTLELANGDRVRLIGVDTPEFVGEHGKPEAFAVAATKFSKQLISGRRVRLEFDRERHDKYQRVLAYVYVGDVLLNEELARQGLAKVMTRFGYSGRMKKRFLAAEAEAKGASRGLWGQTRPSR